MTSEKIMQKEFKKSETIPVIARVAPIYDAEYTQNLRDRVFDAKENVAYIFNDGEYGFFILLCIQSYRLYKWYHQCADRKI